MYQIWNTAEGADKLAAWAADGLTDAEIAAKVGVSRKTLYEWAKRYSLIGSAMNRGKARSNDEVEGALYKKCLGYNVKVKKNFKVRRTQYDKDTGRKIAEYEELVEAEDEVHVDADVSAQKFWLTNRIPERWKNKVELGVMDGGSLEELIRRHEAERTGERDPSLRSG